jgi:hypothetical protein
MPDDDAHPAAPSAIDAPSVIDALEALLVQSRAQQSRLRGALADILVLIDRDAR